MKSERRRWWAWAALAVLVVLGAVLQSRPDILRSLIDLVGTYVPGLIDDGIRFVYVEAIEVVGDNADGCV